MNSATSARAIGEGSDQGRRVQCSGRCLGPLSSGSANDGVIEATLANGLLLQVLVRVGPPHDQSKEHALQYPRVAPTVPDAEELTTMSWRTHAAFNAVIRFRVP